MGSSILLAEGWGQMFLVLFCLFGGLLGVAFFFSSVMEKSKMSDENKGCLWPIVIIAVIAIVFSLGNCKGCSRGTKGDPGGYWENFPRHTQMHKPVQNTNPFCLFALR